MQQHTSPYSIPQSNDNRSAGQGVASRQLPNRLLTAFEVAEFVGCHEETRSPCVPVRPADVAAVRRQRKEVSPGRRPRLDLARRADESLVNACERSRGREWLFERSASRKGCRASPRCDHPWWFDVMHDGKRWRMRVDDFALAARRDRADHVEADGGARLGAEVPGRNRGRTRSARRRRPSQTRTGGADGRGLPRPVLHELRRGRRTQERSTRSAGTSRRSRRRSAELPVVALEKPAEILRFKAAYRQGHEVATVNRALGMLRAAINWGRFQDPPLLSTTPFHRFGVSIKARDETKRDRRIHRDEEQALLAACLTMNAAEHKWVGPAMHDRIIGALETCCRQGEMLRIQNRHVDWDAAPDRHPGRQREGRGEPAHPVRPAGTARADPEAAGGARPERVRVRLTGWRVPGQLQDGLGVAAAASPTGTTRSARRPGARVDRAKLRQIDLHWHDLRHEGACRLLADGVDIRIIQLMLGHSDIKTTQRYLNITDEELRKALTGVWERRRQLKAVGRVAGRSAPQLAS